jgi:hypothetical protein
MNDCHLRGVIPLKDICRLGVPCLAFREDFSIASAVCQSFAIQDLSGPLVHFR